MPPVAYMMIIPEPVFRGKTNSDMLNWALSLRKALRLANSDKRSLTEWLSKHSSTPR